MSSNLTASARINNLPLDFFASLALDLSRWDNLGRRMATFEKCPGTFQKTTWRVRVRRQLGPSLTKSCKKKTDAEKRPRSVEHKRDTGESVPDGEARKRTVNDVHDRYFEVTLPRSKHRKNESEQTSASERLETRTRKDAARESDARRYRRCARSLCKEDDSGLSVSPAQHSRSFSSIATTVSLEEMGHV